MRYSISEAARAVDVSRSTVSRDVSRGRLSLSRDGKGKPYIELVELERVYGNVHHDVTQDATLKMHHDTTYVDALIESKDAEITLLKQQLDMMTQRLDVAESERRRATEQITALLTDQRASIDAQAEIARVKADLEAERARGFWSRLWR